MPEISRFFGIVITMYYNDHGGDRRVKILIEDGAIVEGGLPRRAHALVEDWRQLHVAALLAAWQNIMARRPHDKIVSLE